MCFHQSTGKQVMPSASQGSCAAMVFAAFQNPGERWQLSSVTQKLPRYQKYQARLSSANLKQQWWMAIQISDFSAVQGKKHITHWDALLVTRPQNVERVLRAILTLSKALLIMKSDFMGEKWTFSFGILSLSHVCLCLSIFLSFNRHQQIIKINGSRYTHMINMPTAGDIQNTSALLADTGESLQAF